MFGSNLFWSKCKKIKLKKVAQNISIIWANSFFQKIIMGFQKYSNWEINCQSVHTASNIDQFYSF